MPHRHRVLAVDDNPRNLEIIEMSIAGEFELQTASGGQDAIDLARRFRPDVVLLDIMMPGIDGYETCRRMRSLPALRDCKIIMVSARAATTDRLEGYAAGADDFLSKPFDPDELVAKLRVYNQLKSVEEVDRLRSDLLHLVAHETRTPLNSVLTPVGMLLQAPDLTAEQRLMLEMIQRGGERLLSLVEKVSLWNDLKRGHLERATLSLEVDGLVQSALSGLQGKVEQGTPRQLVEIEPDLRIEADPDQMHTALTALLDNAIRLTPPSGTVRVRGFQEDSRVIVEISDEGPGIAPELLDHLFEGFVVADVRRHSRGHGLSLAIARLIVEQHGGELRVESLPEAGTTFTLHLPFAGSSRMAA